MIGIREVEGCVDGLCVQVGLSGCWLNGAWNFNLKTCKKTKTDLGLDRSEPEILRINEDCNCGLVFGPSTF